MYIIYEKEMKRIITICNDNEKKMKKKIENMASTIESGQ